MPASSALPPCVVFLTGLSGAGKTTIAEAVAARLREKNIYPVLLDGDEIRKKIQLTGFDEATRKKHNLDVGRMAAEAEAEGNIVIVALISPYADTRNEIRKMCSRFIEVYVSTSISVCIRRDPRGLYKKALAGELKDFTGISAPYFPPANPELIFDTDLLSAADCASVIITTIANGR